MQGILATVGGLAEQSLRLALVPASLRHGALFGDCIPPLAYRQPFAVARSRDVIETEIDSNRLGRCWVMGDRPADR
jgi:hypothetical protein